MSDDDRELALRRVARGSAIWTLRASATREGFIRIVAHPDSPVPKHDSVAQEIAEFRRDLSTLPTTARQPLENDMTQPKTTVKIRLKKPAEKVLDKSGEGETARQLIKREHRSGGIDLRTGKRFDYGRGGAR